jgi:hypothetical protein
MTRRISSLTSVAATLLIPALSGCAYLGVHKQTPDPIPIIAQAPSLLTGPVAPLTLMATDSDPQLPELPAPPMPNAQPSPPPESEIVDTSRKPARSGRRRGHKGTEVEVAERETHERELLHEKDTPPAESTPPVLDQNVKVTAPTPTGDTAQPTSIGQITAGPTQDTSESRQEATKLISTTEKGVNSLRNLNGDQNKTVAQIRSFLEQAQRALHNGDVDGASTLATKAKTLLDELTGST